MNETESLAVHLQQQAAEYSRRARVVAEIEPPAPGEQDRLAQHMHTRNAEACDRLAEVYSRGGDLTASNMARARADRYRQSARLAGYRAWLAERAGAAS